MSCRITFLSVPGKVFAHVLLARLDPLPQKHHWPHQSGFTHCRSTLDAILALRLLAEIHGEFQQLLHVAFMDLKVVFDFVDRNAPWKAMHGVGVPSPDHRPAHCNVRQSAPSRPLPPLHRAIHDNLRCKAGMCLLGSRPVLPNDRLHYIASVVKSASKMASSLSWTLTMLTSDDVALLVDKEESFCTTFTAMNEESSKFGLQVSRTKTKLQNLGSGSMPSLIIVDGNIVDSVEEFTYLGSIQSSPSNFGPEYFWRIGLVASAMKRLDCIWSQSKLSIATKLRIYSTCDVRVIHTTLRPQDLDSHTS